MARRRHHRGAIWTRELFPPRVKRLRPWLKVLGWAGLALLTFFSLRIATRVAWYLFSRFDATGEGTGWQMFFLVLTYVAGLAAACTIAVWHLLRSLRRQLWRLQRLRRRQKGLCRGCGYVLRASASRSCPECGWPAGHTDPRALDLTSAGVGTMWTQRLFTARARRGLAATFWLVAAGACLLVLAWALATKPPGVGIEAWQVLGWWIGGGLLAAWQFVRTMRAGSRESL
ncbi:MAG: hypothetical protein ACOCTI_05715 [Phycisphaeraceae bacterium]